ncbi:MAG: 2-nitropropane dioxygenase [Bdellovibrionales bacterium RIFOXYB1_FULL_37_110]|nr:MAG: 2-nitropropane dioxygenase [Bdellovibrionales bacterium RIFOXYA1_FULL_38_20]OFZ52435.1 MAG: 2-nitropropane dioxygenase [Bdellovibrionales bacterium RIFOXYC1_FULL_37_79]OFZ53541.1 MAG: 2-nitropropane dioxygenase [Bdellovibrionales bacterium RIFOXYB2_FULL_36_6]OFZ59637.1 MAG: 2-nitropropane dioxygenase [Bdellovibrionales bacterium RIFOXYB1_FULL_37_110]OFZ62564.1 MAG: 2-nitropropane dioxygenase [Bdellovibrionales bacterium RIFOXYD1_FULL_36_51]
MMELKKLLNIKYSVIMAPMFLVTNLKMMMEADKCGISGCIPALNFRNISDFKNALKELKEKCHHAFGVNVIVNKSNFFLKEQMKWILEYQVPYITTSLGSPKNIILECKKNKILVFSDVVDEIHAKKVQDLGGDALIAVNNQAGGHLGQYSARELILKLKNVVRIPIISAGGVATKAGFDEIMSLGADGICVGSPFIACTESDVSTSYKNACVNFGAKDIVVTNKISGTPCTVIKTPYVEKIGTQQNCVEAFLNSNKRLKKIAKFFITYKGFSLLKKAAFGANYKQVWVAGKSIEYVDKIRPLREIVERLTK